MMNFNSAQQDALVEVCNIGMSKAAKQLSILLDSKVDISIPSISCLKLSEVSENLLNHSEELLSFVYQDILGSIQGRTVLVFKKGQAKSLTDAVVGCMEKLSAKEEMMYQQEAMVEIGNIIISSCLAAMVNMLSMSVNLSIPKYVEYNNKSKLAKDVYQFDEKIEDAFIFRTNLKTIENSISGNLMLVVTSDSVIELLNKTQSMLDEI